MKAMHTCESEVLLLGKESFLRCGVTPDWSSFFVGQTNREGVSFVEVRCGEGQQPCFNLVTCETGGRVTNPGKILVTILVTRRPMGNPKGLEF